MTTMTVNHTGAYKVSGIETLAVVSLLRYRFKGSDAFIELLLEKLSDDNGFYWFEEDLYASKKKSPTEVKKAYFKYKLELHIAVATLCSFSGEELLAYWQAATSEDDATVFLVARNLEDKLPVRFDFLVLS